jgi:hypothetical protein
VLFLTPTFVRVTKDGSLIPIRELSSISLQPVPLTNSFFAARRAEIILFIIIQSHFLSFLHSVAFAVLARQIISHDMVVKSSPARPVSTEGMELTPTHGSALDAPRS